MIIAILSDSHDAIVHVHRAVSHANRAGAEILIHCGDLVSPFMLNQLDKFTGHVHLIYGNNVGDQHLISTRCEKQKDQFTHHGILGSVEVDGKRVGFHHYPELALPLAQSGRFDYVCCGHNHICRVQKIGKCLLINPGDLLGKEVAPGFILLDTKTSTIQHIRVGDSMDFQKEFENTISVITPQ
ncbi:YfcE family phosphodiesterase [Desulfogranum japonicum]|uniref:YfcE family phosphodiesterase n=1 Tax=Desulfogranum japonicum TaxID=231447 RepID=UPI0006888BFA|nr:YfcE family phosphodiesterase [Desulfogranum japonicum]